MADALKGRKVAILAADGVERIELVQPREALENEGADVDLVSVHTGQIQSMNGDIEPADRFEVDHEVSGVGVDDYDALMVPGGTVNPDNLRSNEGAGRVVRALVAAGKPVAARGRAPWGWVAAERLR